MDLLDDPIDGAMMSFCIFIASRIRRLDPR